MNDRCPSSCCDRCDAVWIAGEERPGLAGFVENVVVVLEDRNGEFVAAQIFPDVFDRVELGCVGWQRDERDIVRNGEVFGDVIAGSIKDESGVGTGRDLPADLGQVQRHGLGVGGWDDESRCGAALRADGAEDVGPLVALIVRRTRPGASFGPDAGQCALLADACLVLEPDFDRLVAGVAGEP